MKLFNEMLEYGYALCGGRLCVDEDVYEFVFEGYDEDVIYADVEHYLSFKESLGWITSWFKSYKEDRYDDCGNSRCWLLYVYVPAAAKM